MRSSQLDAAKLDIELTTLLREQFETVFSLFNQVIFLKWVRYVFTMGSSNTEDLESEH